MKKASITIILIIVYLSFSTGISAKNFASASPDNTIEFVQTEDGIKFVSKLRHGLNNNLIAINKTGEKTIYNLDEVKAYRKDGKEFYRKYVVETGSERVERAFMQKVYTRAGYTVYKRLRNANEETRLDDFFVYAGETQEYQMNSENYRVILSFFFPKFNLLYSF